MEIFVILFIVGLIAFLLASLSKRDSYNRTTFFWTKKYDERLDEITSRERGTWSERKLISSLLDYGISPKAIFHDLYVKNGKYGFAQVDVAVATRVGIIVFEVKDYSGWIFGKGRQNQWTQVLNYGNEKNRFYNPVLQNESHIKVLQKQSEQFKDLPFYSVIVFYGNCQLRDISFIPINTFVAKPHRLHEVLDTIFEKPDAEYTDKREVMEILKSAVDNGNDSETKTQHVNNIKDMIGADRVLK